MMGDVAHSLARLTRHRCMPVWFKFEPHQRLSLFPSARHVTIIA